jgi:CubicO group peptidase (beta-lactamase class C family)
VDTPVVDVAPDLKASNENAFHAVTFRHLLSHTSGLDSQWWVDVGQGSGARACAARAIAAVPLIARPGELFSYSNSSYVLAGYLTEVLDGRRWEECVEARVAKHIGAHSITARPECVLLRPVATGYGAAGQPPLPAARWYAPSALTPGGGLVAAPADLARLMRVMRACIGPGGSPAIGAESGFAVPTIGRRFDGWGLGMARYRAADGRVLWGA